MYVNRISRSVDLAPFVDDWDRLSTDNPFVSWGWLSTWWKHYGTERHLYCLIVTDDHGNVTGIAPWFIESSATRGRQIKFLGSGHVCSDYLRILAGDTDIERVTQAIASWLKQANDNPQDHEGDGWDFLSIEGIRKGEPSLIGLRRELETLGHPSEDESALNCWRNNLGQDWDSYVAGLSKNNRRKVRNIRRKYIDVDRTDFAYAENDQQFSQFYDLFVELHQKRRQSLGEPGCFASSEFAGFLREAADLFFQRGELLLSRLLIDGVVAASSLGILSNGIHYVYQTGIDPDLLQHTPGWVLNLHSIMYSQANNIQAIDFLRGDEPYKAMLGSEPVEMAKFRIVANQTGAKVRNQFWRMRTNIKQNVLPSLGFQWGNSSGTETPSI